MKSLTAAAVMLVMLFTVSFAQDKKAGRTDEQPVKKTDTGSTALELAKKTVRAHGGEKLRNMKSLTVTGDVDITASFFQQEIPATFVTIFSGDKYRLEINNPFQPLRQTFDGQRTYTSLTNGFTMPPLNRLGFPLLPRIGESGFDVLALPKEKKTGFRIVSPEGYYTDFYLEKKTGLVKGYDSSYLFRGREVTTSVEIDRYRTVGGIVIPEKYAQRFDLQQMTVYAEFKAEQIIVNTEIADEIFVIDQ